MLRESKNLVRYLEHPNKQEVAAVEEVIGVGESAESMAVKEDVVVLTPIIHGRNVDITMIQKLRLTPEQLEEGKINLMTRLEKILREVVLRGEGDVFVRGKKPKGRVGGTNNHKNDLNPLKTRRKDGKEENHSLNTTSQHPKLLHQLAAIEGVLREVEVCAAEFNLHLL